jgi:hypothetical protein
MYAGDEATEFAFDRQFYRREYFEGRFTPIRKWPAVSTPATPALEIATTPATLALGVAIVPTTPALEYTPDAPAPPVEPSPRVADPTALDSQPVSPLASEQAREPVIRRLTPRQGG